MDWSSLLNECLGILIPALATVIAGWFAILGAKLKNAYQNKVQNETAKAVVEDVVKFVQQVYYDLEGPEKLKKAIEQTSTILNTKGIKISETEITMLIESAVYGLKEGFTKTEVQEVIEEAQENDKALETQIEGQLELSEVTENTVAELGVVMAEAITDAVTAETNREDKVSTEGPVG